VRVHADYYIGDSEGRPRQSSWNLSGEFELSESGMKSDFNYRRYSMNARRHQRFNRYAMLLAKLSAGNSDGYLPMHKRYFLGGLGTLHGYSQDELMGTRYWMANAEYRISFSSTEFAVSFLWDLAQIANDQKLDQAEVRHSLGVALSFDDYFKITLAKRLDRSTGDNPKLLVRFERIF
jgi:hemolysin activation/secretion protein